ncbi:MAG: hypothetical protein JSR72_10300 [Proteobacteria bacterium]|nr:hypothetical protein [Pseudomonadota bacterium]
MIRAAGRDDIDAIVELHCRVLDWSINGRLGPGHVRKMYEALLGYPDSVAFVASRNDRIMGFMVASTDYRTARARLRANLGLAGTWRVLWGSLFHPLDWIDLIESTTVVTWTMRSSGCSAELLAWVTDLADVRGRMAATQCMFATLEELRKRGHDTCLAQILIGNEGPNKFHARIGSRTLASFIRNKVYLVDCRQPH